MFARNIDDMRDDEVKEFWDDLIRRHNEERLPQDAAREGGPGPGEFYEDGRDWSTEMPAQCFDTDDVLAHDYILRRLFEQGSPEE